MTHRPWPVPLTALIYSSTVARTSVRLLWGVLSNFTHTSKTSLRSCCRAATEPSGKPFALYHKIASGTMACKALHSPFFSSTMEC